MSVIPASQEVKIERIKVHGKPGQKVSEIPISTNKPDLVGLICDLSFVGGLGRRIVV
jgi:hypothetical protein